MDSKKPSKILNFLYIGCKNHAKSKSLLKELGISHILNCTPTKNTDPLAGIPNYFEKEKLFKYKRISIYDNGSDSLIPHFDAAYQFIEESKHFGGVLVHCRQGVSRSVSFTMAYLMKKNQFTAAEALAYIQLIRPIAQPNEAFMKQLLIYEADLGLSDFKKNESEETESQAIGPNVGVAFAAEDMGPSVESFIPACAEVTSPFAERNILLGTESVGPSVESNIVNGAEVISPDVGTSTRKNVEKITILCVEADDVGEKECENFKLNGKRKLSNDANLTVNEGGCIKKIK